MTASHSQQALGLLFLLHMGSLFPADAAIGVNWGLLSTHRLTPSLVVDLMKENKIGKVKLFDTDPAVLKALMGSNIDVMVGIPNEMLGLLGSSPSVADAWVSQNVSRYVVKGGVKIRYIAVGNEPFLTSYMGQFQSYVVPALLNLQQSLSKTNLAQFIKLVVPCNADAYGAPLPSQGAFRPDLTQIMTQLVSFLSANGSPFIVNIYPFLSLYQSSDFPQDYAFFEGSSHPLVDGPNTYYNAFDGNFDTLVAALNRIGYGQMPIVIGEVGWPTDGAFSANRSAARAFNQGLIDHVLGGKGSPLRPSAPPADVFLFSLLDEEQKSTLPGNFERHWGIFSFDGQAKYPLNLGSGVLKNARNVQYLPSRWCVANPFRNFDDASSHLKLACSMADCTTLYYGGLCNAIGNEGNISFAFNSYYQAQKQAESSCDFDGLGMVTFLDPSMGDCRFLVGINSSGGSLPNGWRALCWLWNLILVWVCHASRTLGVWYDLTM